jgi:hypothetical protein
MNSEKKNMQKQYVVGKEEGRGIGRRERGEEGRSEKGNTEATTGFRVEKAKKEWRTNPRSLVVKRDWDREMA